jgi:hypothetical protein
MTDRWRLINGGELYDVQADPGQNKDLAGEHPETVKELRDAYDKWWDEISERFDEYCPIVIGSDEENPSRLTCHDLHDEEDVKIRAAVSNRTGIEEGAELDGFWAVEVAKSGTYEFALRRWPIELDLPINSPGDGGKAMGATSAHLKMANVYAQKTRDRR